MNLYKLAGVAFLVTNIFSIPAQAMSWIEKNSGQTQPQYEFIVRSNDLTALVANTYVDIVLTNSPPGSAATSTAELSDESTGANASDPQTIHRVRLELLGSNSKALPKTGNNAKGVSHYFKGSNQSQWITDVPQYHEVRFEEVYPGIDVIYRLAAGQLEYDFVVSPGADTSLIKLAMNGTTESHLRKGQWQVTTPVGNLVQSIPSVYQQSEGKKQVVAGDFTANTDGSIGFELDDYNTSEALIIDPVIEFSGYLGGNRTDYAYSMKPALNGNYLISGITTSLFEAISQPSELRINNDFFVAELDPTTGEVLWISVLGGAQGEFSENMEVDSVGNIVLVGRTESADFPTANAFQVTHAGGEGDTTGLLNSDGFVTKLSPDGSSLIFSTFLGGEDAAPAIDQSFGFELFRGLALDAQDNIYVTGQTAATDFPVTTTINGTGCFELESDPNNPPQSGFSSDVAFAKFTPSGTLLFSACIGGSSRDAGRHIQVTDDGTVYIAGFSRSPDFPTSANAFQTTPVSLDTYNPIVIKMSANLSSVDMATFIGEGFLQQIDIDSSGNIYGVAASTIGLSPTTPGAFQPIFSDDPLSFTGGDGYVFKLSGDGTELLYGTYLGALGEDNLTSIKVDDEGRAIISGYTNSASYPLKNTLPAPPEEYLRNSDVWFSSDNHNSIVRARLRLLNDSQNYISLISRNGVNRAAFGDSQSFGQVVPFAPLAAQYNTSSMAYADVQTEQIDPPYVLAANRDGVNQVFLFDEAVFDFGLFANSGAASEDSTAVLAGVIDSAYDTPHFLVANYGHANTLVQVTDNPPGSIIETSVGRTDGKTTALAKMFFGLNGIFNPYVAIANEFQDIRLYESQSDLTGQPVILNHPVGAVTALAAGDFNEDSSDELVIGSTDGPVEILYLDSFANVINVVELVETGTGTLSVAVTDVDHDSDLDVLVGRTAQDMLYLNDGFGNFILEPSYTGSSSPTKAIVPESLTINACPCFSVNDQAPQEIRHAENNMVISVLNANGTDLELSTLLTGNGSEQSFTGLDFAPGSDSRLLIAGYTTGDQWPQVNSTAGHAGSFDAVYMVLELDQDGDNALDGNDNCLLIDNPDQRDTNSDGYGNICDADLNNDNIVNFLDLALFANAFLTGEDDADFNGDGAVNFVDLAVFRDSFLLPPGPGINEID